MRTGNSGTYGGRRRLLSGLIAAMVVFSLNNIHAYALGHAQLAGIGITTELNLPTKETEEEVSSDNITSAETEMISEKSTEVEETEAPAETEGITTPTETEAATGESGISAPQTEEIQEPVSNPPPKISPVQTGDYTEVRMYVIVGIVALVVMVESIVMRNKARR